MLQAAVVSSTDATPKAPCTDIVTTWALRGLLYHDFGAYVYTIVVLEAFGYISLTCSSDAHA